jgi:hypothetical protein
MENSAAQVVQQNTSTAPVKAAIICLALAWVFALLPIPVISMGGMVVFNIAAFILAIICMSKNAVKPGVGVLAGSIIGTPIMYFIGIAILGLGVANSVKGYNDHAAQTVKNNPAPVVQQAVVEQVKSSSPSTETTPTAAQSNPIAIDGNWQGTYESQGHSPVPFSMVINKPVNGAFDGSESEQLASAGTVQTIQSKLNGTAESTAVGFTKDFTYKGKAYSVRYTGNYDPATKRIQGKWESLSAHAHGTFLAWH